MSLRYEQRFNGTPFKVDLADDWKIRCCDCGLTHTLRFERIRGLLFEVTSQTENRRTAQARRHKAGDLHKGVGGWKMVRGE